MRQYLASATILAALALVDLATPGANRATAAEAMSAHEIAARFATQSSGPRPQKTAQADEAELRRWEKDMLDRARAEADARKREREVMHEAEREARRRAEEAEQRARAEADARKREQDAIRAAEDAARHHAEQAEREARALERERRGDDIPGATADDPTLGDGPRLAEPTEPPIAAPERYGEAASGHFTVLIRMEPGDRGIRRHNKTADPVICVDGGCYVSNGADQPASFMRRHRALGFLRTWGQRAGACSNSLGCVFRDVDLGTLPVWLQPIDMRVVHHDRRTPQRVEGPSDCAFTYRRLTCARALHGGNYVMWIVPESLAQVAGAAALQSAVDDGLPDQTSARLR